MLYSLWNSSLPLHNCKFYLYNIFHYNRFLFKTCMHLIFIISCQQKCLWQLPLSWHKLFWYFPKICNLIFLLKISNLRGKRQVSTYFNNVNTACDIWHPWIYYAYWSHQTDNGFKRKIRYLGLFHCNNCSDIQGDKFIGK